MSEIDFIYSDKFVPCLVLLIAQSLWFFIKKIKKESFIHLFLVSLHPNSLS